MKNLFAIILFLPGVLPQCGRGAEDVSAYDVKISEQRAGGVIEIFANNHSDRTLSVTLQLSNIANAKSDGWPTKVTKRCAAGDRVLMTALVQTDGRPPATYSGTLNSTDASQVPQQQPLENPAQSAPLRQQKGSAPAVASAAPAAQQKPAVFTPVDPDFPYALPYERGTKHTVAQGYNGRASHAGLYAIDFDMPMGTPVCAARDGTVVDLQKTHDYPDSDSGLGNVIAILQADGTVALYCQLTRDGMRVRVGQTVRTGDVLGTSGTTGHSNGPHLHFEVDCTKSCKGVTVIGAKNSIPVVFNTFEGSHVTPESGYGYTAE